YDDRGRIRFDRSAAAVAQRTAYLERVDARLRVSYHDIEDLVHQPGKRVVCWSASSGKTSAIRQFIVRHYGEFILYAARTMAESGRTYILIDEHPQTFKKLTLSQEQQALVTQVCGGRFDAASARTFESLLDRENPVAAHGAHVVRRMLSQRTHDDLLSRYRAF